VFVSTFFEHYLFHLILTPLPRRSHLRHFGSSRLIEPLSTHQLTWSIALPFSPRNQDSLRPYSATSPSKMFQSCRARFHRCGFYTFVLAFHFHAHDELFPFTALTHSFIFFLLSPHSRLSPLMHFSREMMRPTLFFHVNLCNSTLGRILLLSLHDSLSPHRTNSPH